MMCFSVFLFYNIISRYISVPYLGFIPGICSNNLESDKDLLRNRLRYDVGTHISVLNVCDL